VVLIPEDELAGGYAVAGDAGNRWLRDAVVKPERLLIAVGSASSLHAAGQFGDTP